MRGQVSLGRRLMWWAPWAASKPWRLWVWHGTDEWCNPSACLDVPFLGTLIVFWKPLRTMPCPECWLLLDPEGRAHYLPGGYLSGGRVHQDVADRLAGVESGSEGE